MKKAIFLGAILGLLYSIIILVSRTMKDGVVFGIVVSFLLSVILVIIFETKKQREQQLIINCIRRINHHNLMFDTNESSVIKDKTTDIELNSLVSNLKSDFKEQVDISQTINEISDQLTSIALKLASSMKSVASSAEVTSGNSEKQFIMLQEIKLKIEKIYKTVYNLSVEMDETVSYASSTTISVKNGIKGTAVIQSKMGSIRKLFSSISEKIKVLKNYSDEVTTLNSLVNSIAEQTSMLALNASIEAARAGEHGKGFSVVASEVSKLSAETNNVSHKIQDVILTLQQDLLSFAQSIEEGSAYVDESYEVISKNISDFNDVQDSLNISMEKISQMRNSIQEVSLSSENIATNVLDITSFSEEITSQMEETTAEVLVQKQEAGTLSRITDQLTKNADWMLQNVANKVMEGKMLETVKQVKLDLMNQSQTLSNELIDQMITKIGVDAIYISDLNGIVKYSSERIAIGLDLFELDLGYEKLRKGKVEYLTSPIKRRVEDDKYYKFLSIMENGIVYQVGLSLNTITSF